MARADDVQLLMGLLSRPASSRHIRLLQEMFGRGGLPAGKALFDESQVQAGIRAGGAPFKRLGRRIVPFNQYAREASGRDVRSAFEDIEENYEKLGVTDPTRPPATDDVTRSLGAAEAVHRAKVLRNIAEKRVEEARPTPAGVTRPYEGAEGTKRLISSLKELMKDGG